MECMLCPSSPENYKYALKIAAVEVLNKNREVSFENDI